MGERETRRGETRGIFSLSPRLLVCTPSAAILLARGMTMWFNPIIIFLLRSPLHGLLSGSMMLITYAGRKSGKPITLPANWVREGDTLFVVSRRERTWWRNLRGGARVTVRLQGRDYSGEGIVIENANAVVESLRAYFRRVPQWAKYSGLTLDARGEPTPESLARAAQVLVMVEIGLTC